ncbi:MAG: hypothetical protein ACKOGN_02035 [Gammaproteobacteria bacterium]
MSGRSLQGPRSLQRPRALAGLTALSAVLALAAFLAGCTPQEAQPVFHAERNPATLADWQVLQIRAGVLGPTNGVIPYELNTPLFSDYAHKLRTVWLPAGTRAGYGADGALQLPVGSILSKTFYYPRRDAGNGAGASQGALQATAAAIGVLAGGRLALDQVQLIETRLLVRRAQGWQAVSYVWDDSQRHARLQRVGEIIPLELEGVGKFDYVVPDINQCAACHATDVKRATLAPIGLKARHLDRDHDYGGKVGQKNQLVHLEQLGLLETAAPLPQRRTAGRARPAGTTSRHRSIREPVPISTSIVATAITVRGRRTPRGSPSMPQKLRRSRLGSANRRWLRVAALATKNLISCPVILMSRSWCIAWPRRTPAK